MGATSQYQMQLVAQPHQCKVKEATVDLSTALTALKDEELVQVSYYKKDGSLRHMRGYFPRKMKNRLGYAFFLETSADGYAPKNLIRKSISTIYRVDYDFWLIIG
jgi:hypothetical protein